MQELLVRVPFANTQGAADKSGERWLMVKTRSQAVGVPVLWVGPEMSLNTNLKKEGRRDSRATRNSCSTRLPRGGKTNLIRAVGHGKWEVVIYQLEKKNILIS